MAERKYSDGPGASTGRGNVELSLGAEYEVFLNFRGPDTRLNFADCLYHSMDIAGIRVFRDEEEIRKGEAIKDELERAIKSCAICIPIFSENYASSAWCLRELAYMVDRKAMILPIFFDVEPKDVKLKTELYQDALQKHEEEFGCEVVQQWKKALREVARMKGWDLKNTGQGELIRLIVAEVLNKLKIRDKNLPDHLIGIQDRVEDIMHMLNEGSPDVCYLVIHGMGGIGKTTLAKVVFNQISSQFHGCSFLSNVREASKGGKVVQLQKQLLSEILNFKVEIFDSDEGVRQIKRRFRYKKVLIILDDLDDWDQLSQLAEKHDWFGAGSRIIITTRDTNFLPIKEENRKNNVQPHLEEFQIYQMRELPHHHAVQLFCRHAFQMDFSPHDYDDISRGIILKANGLPLALKVIGSSLFGQSKRLWKDTLEKLNLVPNHKVLDQLKISFEMLEDAQKEIFLDMACYFIGEERIYPHYMWKALEFFPGSNIIVLIRKSLIKVDDDDRLLMHDLLIDLGKEIVRQEDLRNPGKRSRLWSPKIALDVVQSRKGTENITALKLIGLSKEHNFTSKEFSRLTSLRLLKLEGGNLVGDFKNLLLSLRWLSWCRCPPDLQAVNLCLENLIVLKLSNSKIPENWNGWGPCLANRDLKVIHLMRCHLSATPNFSRCLNLRILVFAEHCPESPQISSSISTLEHLKRLEISAAGVQPLKLSGGPHLNLCAVPSIVCHLKSLSHLKLEGQCIQELHPSIGEMAGLTCLSLVHCYRLRKLPNSIGKLRSLLELDLFNTRIRKLPDSIGGLKRLEKLNLGWTRIRELPDSIGGLESLLDLDLQCLMITTLPASIGCLKRLKRLFMIRSKIKELPNSIADLKRLEEMNLSDTQIRELPNSIGGLESLLRLDLWDTKITELPASIGCLKMLKELCIRGSNIIMLPKAIGMLENLEILGYRGCRNMDMTWPPKLLTLHIRGDDYRSLTLPPQISTLSLFCDDPRSLTLPPQLSTLRISCDDPGSLPMLPLGLHVLELRGVKSPMKQPLLSELRYLSELTLCAWDLREIVCEQVESLHHFRVWECKSLVISGLSSLGRLKELEIECCSQLIEIQDLGEMESLEVLSIETCSSIERLPDLSKLNNLRLLTVRDCRSLQCLPDLPNSLEGLRIQNLSSIESLPELSKLHKLRWLDLNHCESLQGLLDVPATCDVWGHACPKLDGLCDIHDICQWCRGSNLAPMFRKQSRCLKSGIDPLGYYIAMC